jgi:DNA gyrase/topoisomerase IV subunit A-like protein
MIIRINVSGVRLVGRSTQGVRLMNLYGEDRLVAIAKVEREEEVLVEATEGMEGDGEGNGADGDPLAEVFAPELELEAAPEEDLDDDEPLDEEEDPETVH